MRYKINEIFESLQGEGYWTGQSCIFIRFSGCNLKCSFCDTEHKEYKEMSLDVIETVLLQYKSKHIVLTGGEPMLQVNQEFIDYFKKDYYIHIETNGTIEINVSGINWITVSPKDANFKQQTGNELKLIVNNDDYELPLLLMQEKKFDNFYIQPEDGNFYLQSLDCCLELIRNNPEWKLSAQIHKLLKIK